MDSLRQSRRIRLIVTRHEQAAAMMAATVGRLTGPAPPLSLPLACLTTSSACSEAPPHPTASQAVRVVLWQQRMRLCSTVLQALRPCLGSCASMHATAAVTTLGTAQTLIRPAPQAVRPCKADRHGAPVTLLCARQAKRAWRCQRWGPAPPNSRRLRPTRSWAASPCS